MSVFRTRALSLGLCFSVGLTSVPLTATRSEAAIAIIATANPAGDITLAFIPVYYLIAISGGMATLETFQEARRTGSSWKYIQAALMATFGVIALEQRGEGGTDFTAIEYKSAERAGMTPEEYEAYIAELPQLNAVREEVLARVDSRLGGRNRVPTNGEIAREIQMEWVKLSAECLSPDAARALEKFGRSAWSNL